MGRLRKNVLYEEKLFSNKDFYIENPQEFKGKWNQLVFKNNNDIEIEIGCGKGNFITTKAINNPNINYIAIDKFPTILYKVLNKVKDNNQLKNIKIISIDAKDITSIFDQNEINKIYLNFSDPWPKKHHEKNRLTNNNFLNLYFKILKNKGNIEFKTDNDILYNYTLEVLNNNHYNIIYNNNDIYNDLENISSNIPTEYEIKWRNKNVNIKKIVFSKN